MRKYLFNLKSLLKVKKSILIDLIFYFYISFGFYIFTIFSFKIGISPEVSGIMWLIFLLIILFFKVNKDIVNKE